MTLPDALIEAAHGLSSATVHEAAGKIGALPSRIKPLAATTRLVARAFPVRSPAGDNLFLHHAIYAARRGEALVVDCGEGEDFGAWGEVMAVAAQAAGLAGLVTSGGVRDSQAMVALDFAVFAAHVSICGTGKDPLGAGTLGDPIRLGETVVARGDLVIGDADGVVVIPSTMAMAVIAESRRRDRDEQRIFDRLKAGKTTLNLYSLPLLGAGRPDR